MAQWHLDDIENALNRIGWQVTLRQEDDSEYSFLGSWTIKRSSEYIIYFDGLFDGMGNMIKNPSIDKAYACGIHDTKISLYFYKKGAKWQENLKRFVEEVNGL